LLAVGIWSSLIRKGIVFPFLKGQDPFRTKKTIHVAVVSFDQQLIPELVAVKKVEVPSELVCFLRLFK
jgi:hypothetical protein